jgi:predicted enzyme related to lactoylglutathione lyase
MKNLVQWFEISTTDIERAKTFYEAVFKCNFQFIELPNEKMYMFEGDGEAYGTMGCLTNTKENTPSTDGTIIYFNCEDADIQANRVEAAGGKLIVPKQSIGEFGFIAQFIDTEGNRIGLHSHK